MRLDSPCGFHYSGGMPGDSWVNPLWFQWEYGSSGPNAFRNMVVIVVCLCAGIAIAADPRPRAAEWDKAVEAARKEGKIVIAIPPANELRRELEPLLKQRFGIDAELVSAP